MLLFDPLMMMDGKIYRFNSPSAMDGIAASHKKKRVIHVKWFEPFKLGENANKFLVLFEDGTFYVYFKESNHTS